MNTIILMWVQVFLLVIIAVEISFILYSLRPDDPPNWPHNEVTAKDAMPIPPHNKKMTLTPHPLIQSTVKPPTSWRAQIDWFSCLNEKMFRELEVIRETLIEIKDKPLGTNRSAGSHD